MDRFLPFALCETQVIITNIKKITKMQLIEIEKTNSTSVSCKGKESPYDHPKVYLEINPELGRVACPYCGKTFVSQHG